MGVITNETTAGDLAKRLLKPDRSVPVIVISSASGVGHPYIDVAAIEEYVGDLCEVYTIATGPLTFAFAKPLPLGREVYGGAGRVYGVENAWVDDMYASPLRFCYGLRDRPRVTQALIADAMSAVYASDRAGRRPSQRQRTAPAIGEVMGIVGGRALVVLPGRAMPATVHPELVLPGIPAERMFTKGQVLSGSHDLEANRFDVAGMLAAPEQALANISAGSVILAKVSTVTRDSVNLLVHPSVTVTIHRDSSTDDDLRDEFSPDEVLPVEVDDMSAGTPASVSLLAAAAASTAEPIALIPGGPGWLEAPPPPPGAGADEPHAVEPAQPVLEPAAGPDADDPQRAALTLEISALRSRLETLEQQSGDLRSKLSTARTRLRAEHQHRLELQRAARAASSERALASPGLFRNDGDQFQHEMYLSWAERTTADDKLRYPWRAPEVGAQFLSTLAGVQGLDRAKVAEVAAEIACGRGEINPSRKVHQLRESEAGSSPPVTRTGSETCWRANLQTGSASARRLHYWRLKDGRVELSAVRLHDDHRP